MTSYKNLSDDVRHLKDAIGMKWIRVIGFSALMGLGVWMLIDPSSPEHSTVEKGTVYILKEIWSWPAGIIIVGATLPFILLRIRDLRVLKGLVWIKWDNGYYFFDKKVRKSGLGSLYNGNDLIVFYPEGNKVLELKDYINAEYSTYKKAIPTTAFNCQDAYWNGDENGYSVFFEGKYVPDTTWERRNNDLVVTSSALNKQFKLVDYDNHRDGKIRSAEVMGRNRMSVS